MVKAKKNKLKSLLGNNSKDNSMIVSTIPVKSSGIFSFSTNKKIKDTNSHRLDQKKDKPTNHRDTFDSKLSEGITYTEPNYSHTKYGKHTTMDNTSYNNKLRKVKDQNSPLSKRMRTTENIEKTQPKMNLTKIEKSPGTKIEKTPLSKIEKNPLRSGMRESYSSAMNVTRTKTDLVYIRDGNERSESSKMMNLNSSVLCDRSSYEPETDFNHNKQRLNASCDNIILNPDGQTNYNLKFASNIVKPKEAVSIINKETSLSRTFANESSNRNMNPQKFVTPIRPSSKINILQTPGNVYEQKPSTVSNNPQKIFSNQNAIIEITKGTKSMSYSSSQPNIIFNHPYPNHNDLNRSTLTQHKVINSVNLKSADPTNGINSISNRGKATNPIVVKNTPVELKVIETIGNNAKATSARNSITGRVINPVAIRTSSQEMKMANNISGVDIVKSHKFDVRNSSQEMKVVENRSVVSPSKSYQYDVRSSSQEMKVVENVGRIGRTKSYRYDKDLRESQYLSLPDKLPKQIEFNNIQGLKDEINR